MDAMLKRCSVCKKEKPDSEYDCKTKDGRQASLCKPCRRDKERRYQQQRKVDSPALPRKYHARRTMKKRQYVLGYLLKHPCSQCGHADVRALEFHHRNPDQKIASIASMQNKSYSLATLKAEVEKCIVLCSNCHKIITGKELGFWRADLFELEVFTSDGIKVEYCPPLPRYFE